jgi:hypothetical protein
MMKWQAVRNREESPERNNLAVFYYLSAFEIWPYKRGGLWWERPYKRGGLSCEGNLVVFYYLNPFEIWHDTRGGLWLERVYKRGGLS